MEKEKNRSAGIKPYRQAVPDIIRYQLVSKTFMFVLLGIMKQVMSTLLRSTGRTALTSGDLRFLFVTWQGFLLIVLSFLVLLVYVIFDLNTKILLCGRLVNEGTVRVRETIRDSVRRSKALFSPDGFIIVLYIALIAPVIGFSLSISLTEKFYIPTFISSVIQTTPVYNLLYTAALTLFLLVGFMNVFCLHGVLLDGMFVRDARKQSTALIRQYWKNYIKENFLFTIGFFVVSGILVLLFGASPVVLGLLLADTEQNMRFWFILAAFLMLAASGLYAFLSVPFQLLKITQLYYSYKEGERKQWPQRSRKRHPVLLTAWVLIMAAAVGTAWFINKYFDDFVPQSTDVKIVAHRGGGNEGAENTVSGMEAAWELGAWGSEIDIQRTADGYYILNHDGTFARTAGVNRKPEEMTLEEVRSLDVNGEPVPTLEEMLEASRGKVILFIELKGNTADRRMAEDAVRILKEMNMEDQAVLISLKYDLIDYIESTWPEIRTGYLTFMSFGDISSLNCDYIGLEEEAATYSVISAVHEQGKQVLVWTVNEAEKQRTFMLRDIDGIITDNVAQAAETVEELEKREDLTRLFDLFLTMW
ncbi:MAG: glycerophosphoryl diester phosphodiesterase membrane domain-containing protein [Solobacterium sp.]|nr:glycerophosphoryl diester phosphodiesterase membrane domain-containing protein [Solobacterium sp.]